MKKLVYLFVSIFVIVVTGQNVKAQNPEASAAASASATIIEVISIEQEQDMYFGNIIADADGGTVTIGTDGSVTNTGIDFPTGNEGTRQQAIFEVEGQDGVTYEIDLPASVTISDGTNDMTVDGFTSDPDGTGALTGGTQNVNVGATLNVGASQVAGEYQGSFTVTVSYN